jgi:hypothetical protein
MGRVGLEVKLEPLLSIILSSLTSTCARCYNRHGYLLPLENASSWTSRFLLALCEDLIIQEP